jgi:hypothetical protein
MVGPDDRDDREGEETRATAVSPLEDEVAPLEGDLSPLDGDVAPTGRDAMQMSPTASGGVSLADGSEPSDRLPLEPGEPASPPPESGPVSIEPPAPEAGEAARAAVETAAEPTAPPPEEEKRPAGPVIAVLNHDDVLIEDVCEALEAVGFHAVGGKVPVEEGGYVDILKFLVDHDPDVVVFDVVQPFADYLETLKAVRRAPEAKHRKFVVTTTDRAALQARGVPSAVQFREPEDLERVTDAVRAAVEQLGRSAQS